MLPTSSHSASNISKSAPWSVLWVCMKIILYIGAAVFIALIIDTVRFYLLIDQSKKLVEASRSFEVIQPDADMKILVLGDSTAVGTGVDDPHKSTAGRLSERYPEAEVKNISQNGLKTRELLERLDTLDAKEHYSLVLIQIGANDIIRFTSMKEIEKDIDAILARLSKQSDQVVILHSGDVGEAPFFPLFMRPIYSSRSYEMRDLYSKLSSTYGAQYVDLIGSAVGELIKRDPKTYYADDLLHLSNEGYGLWFEEIEKNLTAS